MESDEEGVLVPKEAVVSEPAREAAYAKMARVLGVDVREASRENLAALKTELGDLSPEEERVVLTVKYLGFVLQHKALGFESFSAKGELTSLDVRGLSPADSMHTTEKDKQKWGNTGFVFFHLLPRKESDVPISKGKAFTTLRFEPSVLYETGWVSLDDWHNYHSGSGAVSYFGDVVRKISFTEDEKTYCYAHSSGPKTTIVREPTEEVFFDGDILSGIARLFVREARMIGGEFQSNVFKAAAESDTESFAKLFNRVFRLEAKIPERIPLDNLIRQ